MSEKLMEGINNLLWEADVPALRKSLRMILRDEVNIVLS